MIKGIIRIVALILLYALSEALKPEVPAPDPIAKVLYYLPYGAVMVIIFVLTSRISIPVWDLLFGNNEPSQITSAPTATMTPSPTPSPTPIPTPPNTPIPTPKATPTPVPAPTTAVRTFEADDPGPDGEGNYLDHFTFTDKATGSCNIYNTRWVQFNVAWKTAEGDDQNSDIDLEIRIRRANGELIDSYKFTPSQDDTGKDENGYYYVGSKWFNLFPNREYHAGEQFKIEYEAFTANGQRVTGKLRSGDIHTWVKTGSIE